MANTMQHSNYVNTLSSLFDSLQKASIFLKTKECLESFALLRYNRACVKRSTSSKKLKELNQAWSAADALTTEALLAYQRIHIAYVEFAKSADPLTGEPTL